MPGAFARERFPDDTFSRAALEADWRLAEVSDRLEFLLHVTPVNTDTAWRRFAAAGYSGEPELEYRPLACDPAELERLLAKAPVDEIPNPTAAELLREKRDELAAKLAMLRHRGTERFFEGSLRVYGEVDDGLLELAKRLLYRLPAEAVGEPVKGRLDAAAFAARAERELQHYRRLHPEFAARVEVSRDVPPSLMVSGDRLLVGAGIHVPKRRTEALIHHEIGTHLVTRFNGTCQPLRLLACGLAGYDVLQEGLAVLSEFLVGGLNRSRFRILAGRVVAVRCLTSGASFAQAFRELADRFGFDEETAFTIAARVYRSGGLTKDAVYLRGLTAVLDYLAGDGNGALEPLLVGKVDLRHAPAVRDLLDRGLLLPPALVPRYLDSGDVQERLDFVRGGVTPLDLLDWRPR